MSVRRDRRPASDQLLARIAERLKALADPTRLRILHCLQDGELCVSDVIEQVGGSQANVSKHLGILRRAELVAAERKGLHVHYRIADPATFTICRLVCDSLERQLVAGKRAVERGRAAMGRG